MLQLVFYAPLLIVPARRISLPGIFTGTALTMHPIRSEASVRGARMLRTALGSSISTWLEDPAVFEVMLNPDGRLWVDRLEE